MELLTYQPLMWLIAVAVLALGLRFSLVERPAWQRFLSFGFRVLGILFLILALCRPIWSDKSDELHVVFLVDVSQSVDLEAAKSATEQIEEAIERLDSGDSWSLFAVAGGVRKFEQPQELAALLETWKTGMADDEFRSASRLADAMLDTRLAFPAGKSRRVVLFSDGQETDADIASALDQMRAEKIDLRLNPIEGLSQAEAAVVSIEPSTPTAFYGEVVRMRVQLAANKKVAGKLRIIHKGVSVLDKDVELVPDKPNIVNCDVNMTTPGASNWTAELIVDEDYFPVNNQGSCTVTVRGRPRVLVLHEKPAEMRSFARVMKEQDIELDVRGKFGLPESLEGILAFDAIMVADLAATALSVPQMEMLRRYVIDFGGGLVMLGSENSFGLGGYYKTPVEEVLPLVSRFEKEKEKPSLAMVLVIDKSGSMDGLPIALARQAAKAAVELLSPRDTIGVVGFDGSARVISDMRSAAEADAVKAEIDSLAAGGGTYMYVGMELGKSMLENASAKIRHMIILSDGYTQHADHEGLTQAMTEAGITVSTVALGGADRQLMATIAEIGRGRYYETNDPANVPQIFTKETMQASRSAIKEDLFASVQTGDHPILAGYREGDLPYSLGYVMTEAKPTAQLLLVAETGDPLLAVARYGLGTGMAYTSDLTERWGGEWLAWDDGGRFWAQAIRGVLRKTDAEGLHLGTSNDTKKWSLDITRTAANGTPVSGIAWDASVLDENGKKRAVQIEQVGLGRYQASIPLESHRQLSLILRDKDHEKMKVVHFHRPYPKEYRLGNKRPESIAKLSPIAASEIRGGFEPERRRKSVSHFAYFAALACLLLGILLRRV